jgi:hypothetical protein
VVGVDPKNIHLFLPKPLPEEDHKWLTSNP